MKKINYAKTLLPVALLPLASAVQAKVQSVGIEFTTLPEITIVESRALSYGNVLALSAAAACAMTVDSGNTVGPALDKSSIAAAGTPGALGTGCGASGTPGTPGIYLITGIQGSELTVEINGSTNADLAFVPSGYVVDFDTDANGGDATGDDAATNITNGTPVDVYAPTTGEFSGTVQPGVVGLVVGGTVTNQRALLADTTVTADFTVDVIYK